MWILEAQSSALHLFPANQYSLKDIWRVHLLDDSLFPGVHRPLYGPELCQTQGRGGGAEVGQVEEGSMILCQTRPQYIRVYVCTGHNYCPVQSTTKHVYRILIIQKVHVVFKVKIWPTFLKRQQHCTLTQNGYFLGSPIDLKSATCA